VILQDLLELAHWVTRLKVTPEASAAAADSERTQGLAMAQKLSMAALTRAWALLMKGLEETLRAPSPARAAEMALIRLCYAADLPSPADALKALQSGGGSPAAGGAPAPRGGGGGGGGGGAAARLATSQPASAIAPQPVQAEALPNPRSFTEVVALFESKREARLVNALMHHVHEVRCEPGVIEFRPEKTAPPDLASRLSDLLGRWTGKRWLASVSNAEGKPTLAQQKAAKADDLRATAEANPLVQAILKTFPGAKLEAVRRKGEDASLLTGLHGAIDEEPPPGEEYPADDDIPESEY